jgi:hypothetical protein
MSNKTNSIQLLFLWALLFFFPGPGFAQTVPDGNLATLAGDTSTRFHSVFGLSDGTYLVGGEARNLNWLPGNVSPTTLTLPRTPNSASPKIAFILQLSSDLKTILKAVRFPDNTVQNVFKIKTDALPGATTGNIFISGSRQNEQTTTGLFAGYYLARLNGNFLNGNTPTSLSFIYDVATRPIQSNNNLALSLMNQVNQYKAIQPWDVQSDGKIVFGQGHAYSASWASVNRLTVDGLNQDSVPFWPMHSVRIASTLPAINNLNTEYRTNDGAIKGDSILYTNNNLGFSGKVAIDSLNNSTLVFKVNRSGSNLRSLKENEFSLLQTDENGNAGRFGKYPEDFMYPAHCETGNCSNTGENIVTRYQTDYGNNDNATHRMGDIVIDKRNNHMYIGYSTLCKHPKSKLQGSDVESIVLAMDHRGKTLWWNRLHKEVPSEGSSAAQEIDGLALDYANNQLYVAGASLDTCLYNFWRGDEIALNPGQNGVQNRFTGTNSSIRFAWLGKMNLSDGKMRAATYVGEYNNDIGQAGTTFSDPLLDGWPDPNTGNPNLDNTRILGINVSPDGGSVVIRGEGTRTITTKNAYQRMPKTADGLAPRNHFVRVYSADLDSIRYSTSMSLLYEPNGTNNNAPNLGLSSALVHPQGIMVVGSTNSATGKLATLRTPAFGDSLAQRKRGFMAWINFNCDTVARPLAINGAPAISCQGGVYTFTTPALASDNFVWSYPKGWIGSDSASSSNTASLTVKALANAEAGKIVVARKSSCGVSLPFGINIAKPLPTSISISTNPGFTAATYNLPSNTAVWFVNGDTARRANGTPIRTSTIVFSQIVPPLSLPDTLTAIVTNDCGTYESAIIILTSNKKLLSGEGFSLRPNPTTSMAEIQVAKGIQPERIRLFDLMGKEIIIPIQTLSSGQFRIQVGHLANGVYQVRVETREGIYQKRLVKR